MFIMASGAVQQSTMTPCKAFPPDLIHTQDMPDRPPKPLTQKTCQTLLVCKRCQAGGLCHVSQPLSHNSQRYAGGL